MSTGDGRRNQLEIYKRSTRRTTIALRRGLATRGCACGPFWTLIARIDPVSCFFKRGSRSTLSTLRAFVFEKMSSKSRFIAVENRNPSMVSCLTDLFEGKGVLRWRGNATDLWTKKM